MQWIIKIIIVILSAVALAIASVYWHLQRSLPLLNGEVSVLGLDSEVVIKRDRLGMASIEASSRSDASYALGFVHAQERFFQMDLLRRTSSGELAALLGASLMVQDERTRAHRLRVRAKNLVAQLAPNERKQLESYVKGVNAGLNQLGTYPFEYLLLRETPQAWLLEDSILSIFAMYLQLQPADGNQERHLAQLKSVLTPEQFDFFLPTLGKWDTPLFPISIPSLTIPDMPPVTRGLLSLNAYLKPLAKDRVVGSNNWAVDKTKTHDGRAIVADDMHLNIRVPNTWFKASIAFTHNNQAQQVIGLTLPGMPAMVVGSNTRIAWGFTNSYGDFHDVILLEVNADESEYLTPEGWRPFARFQENIAIRGGETHTIEVRETQWGPVIGKNKQGQLMAYRWVLHDRQAANLKFLELELTSSLNDALSVANRMWMPAQNFVAGDDKGNIGWTIAGAVPKRLGYDGRLPTSWAKGDKAWQGYQDPNDYPRVITPQTGFVATANSRVVDPSWDPFLGTGRYALGARSKHIAQRLQEQKGITEQDMHDMQQDEEARFMQHWYQLFMGLLERNEAILSAHQTVFFNQIKSWNQKASADSVAYRLIREARDYVHADLLDYYFQELRLDNETFDYYRAGRQWENAIWQLITIQPPAWLPPSMPNWDAWLLSIIEQTFNDLIEIGPIEGRTWGEWNQVAVVHPLTHALEFLSPWLNPSPEGVGGDDFLMKVQQQNFGQSQRMVVSPGNEDEGILQLPTGQSGHPLSPYYLSDHEAWIQGKRTPFLPGATEYILMLIPQ
ncbi:MAG: penicillin acylase family protein [Pseudomonadota bacterium]